MILSRPSHAGFYRALLDVQTSKKPELQRHFPRFKKRLQFAAGPIRRVDALTIHRIQTTTVVRSELRVQRHRTHVAIGESRGVENCTQLG